MTRHILIANVYFAPFSYGGATIVAQEVAFALHQREGYRITVVSTCIRDDLAPYVVIKTQKAGIANYLINLPRHRSYSEAYANPMVTERLSELIAHLRPDVVHAHCLQDIGTGVLTAAQAYDTPVILSVHDFWWLCERQFMIRMDQTYCGQNPIRLERCKGCCENFWAAQTRAAHLQSVASQAALVTYPSRFAQELSEASGFALGLGVVWQNGVRLPDEKFFARQMARRATSDRVVFGYLGGPSQIKGWPQIKRAFAGITDADFEVRVVEGSLDQSWWRQEMFKDLPGNWRIIPRFDQDDMDDFYAEIDVLLFMSQWKETFGLAIREALARGVDVIQTDSGGTVEHPAAEPNRLIPIGAPPDHLQSQIEAVLETGAHPKEPISVMSFDAQANAFVQLLDQVLGKEHEIASPGA